MLNLDDRETAQPVKYGWTDRMFSLTSTQRYFLFNGAVDMRKGFDGLCRTRWDMMIRFPARWTVYPSQPSTSADQTPSPGGCWTGGVLEASGKWNLLAPR